VKATLKNPRTSQYGDGHTSESSFFNADTFETVYDYRKVNNDQLKEKQKVGANNLLTKSITIITENKKSKCYKDKISYIMCTKYIR
jgi:hypothetical protein